MSAIITFCSDLICIPSFRRISKETVKPCGRQFGKLGHSNPGILFDLVMLSNVARF